MKMQEEMSVSSFMEEVKKINKNLPEPEFYQAVEEWATSIIPYLNENPGLLDKYKDAMFRVVRPDRVIKFTVNWVDDHGKMQYNTAWRIEHNNVLGIYKGGLRLHPSVNEGILKFLAFEQTFKNALPAPKLRMGGAKGGSDFDPKGKSDNEIRSFCQSFMTELFRYIGPDIDVPAGDIGVGGREIGYLIGQYKRLTHRFDNVLTGKGLMWGGSQMRPEATGYGDVYFVEEMMKYRGDSMKGKVVAVSGKGNVAQYAIERVIKDGGRVVTASDSSGMIYDPEGIDAEFDKDGVCVGGKLKYIMDLENVEHGRISEYVKKYPKAKFYAGQRPWSVKCDVALPCATQNELDGNDAETLLKNGCKYVGEGANMPSTPEAIEKFIKAKIAYSPGKASNVGGVGTSMLELEQNYMNWDREQVNKALYDIMVSVHEQCVKYGLKKDGSVNYVDGANRAAAMKVFDAMIAQGMV